MINIFIAFLVFCGTALYAAPLKVSVTAPQAILINAKTGAVLYEKNAHVPVFPASTTKIGTALYILSMPGVDFEKRIAAPHDAVGAVSPQVRRTKHPSYRLEFGGTHMGIKAGEELSLKTLFTGLMVNSANDAANVLAHHLSGSVPTFMQGMNDFLKTVGCKNTVFDNPHGLPSDEHKTSAYDLAIMAKEGMKYPLFREVVKTAKCPRPATNKQAESILVNTNALLRPGRYYYPKAVGVKSGYTIAAGGNLVAAAVDGNRSLIAVVLGCKDLHNRYQDVITLFEAGFNEKKMERTLFAKGYDLFSRTVKGGKTPLRAALIEDMILDYYSSEEPTFKASLKWKEGLKAPIALGEVVGEIRLKSEEGKDLMSLPVYAASAVERTFFSHFLYILQLIKRFLLRKEIFILLVLTSLGCTIVAILKTPKKQEQL